MKKYVSESIARFRQFSIEKKLKWLRMVVIIPALVGIITLLVIMINFNESYNEAVKNVSVASKFNFSFSEDMDYKMYRIVIGAESFDTMKPYEEIKEAKELPFFRYHHFHSIQHSLYLCHWFFLFCS